MIIGEIAQVTPSSIAYSYPIAVTITYNCRFEGIKVVPWFTRLSIKVDGLTAQAEQIHIGESVKGAMVTLRPGTMPNRAVSGSIVLEAGLKPVGIWKYIWMIPFQATELIPVASRRITIHLPKEIIPVTPTEPTEPGLFPGIPTFPAIPGLEEKTLGIPNKYFLYAGIGCAIAALLYFFVFRRKGRKR